MILPPKYKSLNLASDAPTSMILSLAALAAVILKNLVPEVCILIPPLDPFIKPDGAEKLVPTTAPVNVPPANGKCPTCEYV